MFKLALDRLPSGLCSQSTISRLENLPDIRALLRLGGALIEQYCGSFRQVPKRIVLDIDDTFDACMASSSCACSTPITTITASNRLSSSTARAVRDRAAAPGKRPGARDPAALRRLVGASAPLARSRSCCAPTAIMPPRSLRLVPRQPRRLGAQSRRPALRRHVVAGENHRRRFGGARAARYGASRNSTMPPQLEPGRAHHRPGRGRPRGRTPALS